MNQPETREDFTARALNGVKAEFLNLRALIATAEHVSDIFPLWDALRELGEELDAVIADAADQCETLQKEQ